MASEDPIAAKILSDLKDTSYRCTSLFRLSGGSANFTYRGILAEHLPDERPTIIIKHAEPYVAINSAWELDVIRLYYEKKMLNSLHSLPEHMYSGIHVTTPRLYEYSSTTNSAVIQDYPGSLELKTYLTSHPVSLGDATRVGTILGSWLKSFHVWAAAPEQSQLRATMAKNFKMAELKYAVNYGRTEATIELFPKVLEGSKSMFKAMAGKYKVEMERGDGDLIHGDFWSGNILLRDGTVPPRSEGLTVLVIDWELSHIGHRAFDLGQMFAELYLLSHFRSIEAGVQLISSFMAGYGPLDDDLAFRVALHFGVHLIVWPCRALGWGEGEIMERCVQLGRDFCEHAWGEDREYFRGGVLHSVFYPAAEGE